MVEHDTSSRGEVLIVEHLLYREKSILGRSRYWFNVRRFVQLYEEGNHQDIVSVLSAIENLDVTREACYRESGGDVESEEWKAFTEWYTSLTSGDD